MVRGVETSCSLMWKRTLHLACRNNFSHLNVFSSTELFPLLRFLTRKGSVFGHPPTLPHSHTRSILEQTNSVSLQSPKSWSLELFLLGFFFPWSSAALAQWLSILATHSCPQDPLRIPWGILINWLWAGPGCQLSSISSQSWEQPCTQFFLGTW